MMKQILVYNKIQPCLNTVGFDGLYRDRNPGCMVDELDWEPLSKFNLVDLTDELKQILLEDLAFAFGQESKRFREKLIEFELI